MNRGSFTAPFRKLGLMHILDKTKFFVQRIKNAARNEKFRSENVDFVLPPDYMLYEAFQLDYEKYRNSGLDTATELIGHLSQYCKLKKLEILDWGCGPSRVVRHLPTFLPSCQIHGSDYNHETISWNQKNIQNVNFQSNGLHPPLKFGDDSMHLIYGLSVFTHLSEPNHSAWIEELARISRPGAVWYLTTQGEAFKEKMTSAEIQQFDKGELVVRGNVIEGHRVFSAFHPTRYMQELFSRFGQVLEHKKGKKASWGVEQDVWIVQLFGG